MNDKDQQIRKMLEAGISYSQIQRELKVSPTRISIVKSALPKGKQPNGTIHSGNSSGNSRNSSGNSSSGYNSDQNYHDNSSDKPEILSRRDLLHEFSEQSRSEMIELEKKRLENEELSIRMKEKELKLHEEQLQFQIHEAERPKRMLVSRLKMLLDGYDIAKLSYPDLIDKLGEANSLLNDYKFLFLSEHKPFEGTNIAEGLGELISLFEKIANDWRSDRVKSVEFVHKVDLLIIKNKLIR